MKRFISSKTESTSRFPPSITPSQDRRGLYIVIYSLSGSDHGDTEEFYWALVTGTRAEIEAGEGTRYNVWEKEDSLQSMQWEIEIVDEKTPCRKHPIGQALGRFLIGEIEDEPYLRIVLEDPYKVVQGDSAFTCRLWVKSVYEGIKKDEFTNSICFGTSVPIQYGWPWVESNCKDEAETWAHKEYVWECGEFLGRRHRQLFPAWDLIRGTLMWPGNTKAEKDEAKKKWLQSNQS
ncbi:hypothetical protein MMC28_007438 [Mycoblastus sanguinarius]|nr:hypothetical protein [Mycoblastus sanguinarius]